MSEQAVTEEDRAARLTPRVPWRISSFRVLPGFRLALVFNDGTSGEADFSRLVRASDAGLFARLADEQFFAQVRLELGAVSWPNGADVDPCWMYDEVRAKGNWTA